MADKDLGADEAVHYLDEASQLIAVQLAIAMCKEEVESVIGKETIILMDSGSPWARAFMRTIKGLRDGQSAPNLTSEPDPSQ